MKRSLKFLMVAALTLGSTAAFAQKFGRIDYQSIIPLMPEFATVQTDFQKVQADYMEHLESMNVEVNRKMDELSKLPDTTSETSRQLKNREVVELQQRLQEYYGVAEEGLAQTQADLIKPLQDKAAAAVQKISKAQGLTVVFQTGSVIYIDENATTDITPAVKTELGIAADAVAPAPLQ